MTCIRSSKQASKQVNKQPTNQPVYLAFFLFPAFFYYFVNLISTVPKGPNIALTWSPARAVTKPPTHTPVLTKSPLRNPCPRAPIWFANHETVFVRYYLF